MRKNFVMRILASEASCITHPVFYRNWIWNKPSSATITLGKQWAGDHRQSKPLWKCAVNLQSCCLWDGCFEGEDQVCARSQSAAVFKVTLVRQDSDVNGSKMESIAIYCKSFAFYIKQKFTLTLSSARTSDIWKKKFKNRSTNDVVAAWGNLTGK